MNLMISTEFACFKCTLNPLKLKSNIIEQVQQKAIALKNN